MFVCVCVRAIHVQYFSICVRKEGRGGEGGVEEPWGVRTNLGSVIT